MVDGILPADVRRDLVRFSREVRRRKVQHNSEYPSPWHPTGITNPHTGSVFTDAGAWDWVADQLEAGVEVWKIILDQPPGKTAWYFTFATPYNSEPIYIKLQLCGDHVRGRSFHYSEIRKT